MSAKKAATPPTLPLVNSMGNAAFTHKVKCWAENFDAILSGAKKADVRTEDDRKYKAGDFLDMTRTDRAGQPTQPVTRIYIEIAHVERFAGPLSLVGVEEGHGVESSKPAPIAVLSLVQRFHKVTE